MTKYEELRNAFSDYDERTRKYVRQNESIARAIVDGFSKYAGIPARYEQHTGQSVQSRPYMPVYSINDHGDTKPASFLEDALSHNADGEFSFAFGVTLERQEGAFPKHVTIFPVKCARTTDTVNIDLAGRSIVCSYDGTGDFDASGIHDAIFDMLSEWLSWKLGDGSNHSRFGFRVGN